MAGFPQSNIDWSKYMEGLVSKANIDLDNLSEVGEAKLRESGGGGLEILDIGIAPFGIDESKNLRRYLNGQTILQSQFTVATEKIKSKMATMPNLFCTNEEFEAELTMSDKGQCGKFVVDDIAGTIRLPKVINIQGLFDLQNAGLRVDAGLPNITGNLGSWTRGYNPADGAFRASTQGTGTGGTSTSAGSNILYNFNASRSNPIYGKSTTVQEEAIQYPYFIQLATGATEKDSVINEYQLNNPYSLLDCKWSDHKLSNISWLLSQGQFNNGAVYVSAYNLLLEQYNAPTIEGLSVKKSDEVYTDYDFVINTANTTFRLPLKTKLASGSAIKGNGMTLGVTDGTNYGGLKWVSTIGTSFGGNTAYGKDTNVDGNSAVGFGNERTLGITSDSSKSGIETDNKDLYLYFYVGETVENANLIDAGRIQDQFVEIRKDIINPIGAPCITLSNTLKDNEIWLEGAIVSRTTYDKLFAEYGTLYGEGDGSTTFQLPDFRNKAIWGSGDGTFGYIEAGLPNIAGNATNGIYKDPAGFSGALRSTAQVQTGGVGGGRIWRFVNYAFNASYYNSIYGKSSTVQPPSIKVRVKTRYK